MVEKINWQKANSDDLTGLPNRSLFFDRLDQAVVLSGRTGVVAALLFIDLEIVQALANLFQIHEHSVRVSASIGVSSSPKDAQTTQSLMSNADLAMYAAKSAGRNQVAFFSPDLLALSSGESTFGRF